MDSDQRNLLSDSSRSALSLQDPNYIPDESERDSIFQRPNEDDRVSLRSQSSSISTTTDDQASLLPRRDKDRLNSLERPPRAPSNGQRRVKSAAVTSALSRRRRGIQPIGEELEIIKAHLSLKIPRAADLGSQWNAEVDTDNESGTGSNFDQRRIKSALPYNWLGRSRAKVAPATISDDDDDEKKDTHSISSSINAWEPNPPNSQPTSQTSLISSGTRSRSPGLFGRSKGRIYPALSTEEADDATNSVTSGRGGTPDVFVSDTGLAVEEATGEMINEPQEPDHATESSNTNKMAIEIPHSVEHEPYIPLASAQDALIRVVNDMKRMKEEHIDLVERMQGAYREIEEESKVQYKVYVQQLKKQHGSKMAVYKQVVKVLQEEMDKMKEHWEGTANSLANSNRNLLLENRGLYQQLKDGVENMKLEKEKTVMEFTERIEVERRKREEEKRDAQQEIYSMQTKCSGMVRQAEQSAEEKLAKEKAHHEQLMEELGKQLAERQAKMKELEESLALERASGKDATKVVLSKEVEAVPLLSRPMEPQQSRVEIKAEKSDSQLSHAEEIQLKKKIGRAQKELRQARVKLQSMATLVGTEPGLRDALEERIEKIKHEIDTLKVQRDELTEEGETENDKDESVSEKEAKLDEINSNISDMKHKLELMMQLLQTTEGSIPTLSTKKAKPAVIKERQPSEEEDTKSTAETPNVEASLEEGGKDESKSGSVSSMAAMVDEEKSPATLADESHIDLYEEELLDDSKEEEFDDELEEERSNDQETEEMEEVEAAMEEGENTEVVHEEQSSSTEGVSKPKTEARKTRGVEPSLQQGAHSQSTQGDPKFQEDLKKLRQQVNDFKKQQQTDKTTIKSLQKELKFSSKGAAGGGGAGSTEDKRELKKKEKEIKDLNRQNEIAKKNLEKIQAQLKSTDSELSALKKDNDKLVAEMKEKSAEFQKLTSAAKNAVEAAEKAKMLEQEVKMQSAELKTLSDNYNSERILRKKYYNLIEDMKGKIRVYCRARPLSSSEKARNNYSVIESPDEYTLNVRTSKALKEFQFDQVFTPEHSQEKVFEDTKNLIQSAVDGYNVCIFAYGQTGSGKTYTMIGGKDSNNQIVAPGIAPRAFETIYELVDANKSKFNFGISCYMLELYNDKLLDLFQTSHKEPPKLDIKKDKKGLVVVNGAIVHHADSAVSLMELFELGSKNRHVSSTKMNAESSRSHLVVGIVIESTNITNGTVHRGKLSIVDLAGSERASKTGATPEQLREAQSINKSLSALGDVISALSSGQDFIPYRNNKLTMLMQDSLGGNAKTLMFVNISPADYNADETVISLTYAARVKLITNDASKNADNKEIARLKGVIAKLKKGETVDDD